MHFVGYNKLRYVNTYLLRISLRKVPRREVRVFSKITSKNILRHTFQEINDIERNVVLVPTPHL
jgi:hypothetical protein